MSIADLHITYREYDEEKVRQALDMLFVDRKNEFHELATVVLNGSEYYTMDDWEVFVLEFCLGVDAAFQTWSGQQSLSVNSPQKALTILRQLSRGMTSMNQLVPLLNISYTLSVEFKEIYRRLT